MKNYHKNPRQIKDKQFANLRAWLAELGDLSGIVHDLNTDEVISGNQRMRAIDIARCEIVLTEGPHDPDAQGTVAHGYVIWQGAKYNYRQVRWTPEQCEKANIVANKAGGSWDFDILANEWEKDDLLEWGFEDFELGMFPDDEVPEDPGGQIDRASELQEQWQTAVGQLWAIGEHRLAVGDCTDAAVVARVMGGEKARLMLTDPPYGIEHDTSWREQAGISSMGPQSAKGIEWDGNDDWTVVYATIAADVAFVWHASSHNIAVAQALVNAGYEVKQMIVWNKTVAPFGRSHYSYKHEPCWYAVRKGCTANWHGPNNEVTVWDAASPRHIMGGSTEEKSPHPTQKPLEIFERPIVNHTGSGDVVVDPFLGSGTTMVAAHRLGRRCFGCEIDPGYAAVTLQRMSDMGLTPELI